MIADIVDFSADMVTSLLGKMRGDSDMNQMATMETTLARLSQKIKDLSDERLANIEKNRTEQAKADKKNSERKSGGIFGWLKRIFKAIAAVIMVAVAAVATVATLGTAAPLLALAVMGLAATAVSIASDIDKERGGKGFDHITKWMDPGSLVGMGVGKLATTLGASEEQAAIVSATFAAVTTVAIMVASAVLSGGATGAEAITKAIAIAGAITGMVTGAMSIAEGVSDRGLAEIERDISLVQAEMKKILAVYVETGQQREELMEDMKKLMNAINELPSMLSSMLKEYSDSLSEITGNMVGAHPA